MVDEIGQRIVTGEFAVGKPLPGEMNLCKTLGVSRTPLREALRELAAKGLVVAKPKVGTLVRGENNWNFLDEDILAWRLKDHGSARVIEELYELRHLIEPIAASLAAKNAKQNDIAALQKAYAKMEAAGEDGEKVTEPDLNFHRAIIAASGNRLFSSLTHSISAALFINFDFMRDTPRGHRHFMRGHKAVLDAIMKQNSAAARVAMQALIEDSHRDARAVGTVSSKKTKRKAVSGR
ncbi:MAG: FadR/GntR family transcriptional regulator [Betaproteobacteria bacterium]